MWRPHTKVVKMENTIKVLRAVKGITQGDLAQALGVSRQTINAIEKSKYNPSLELAFKLAEYFETPIESMFTP